MHKNTDSIFWNSIFFMFNSCFSRFNFGKARFSNPENYKPQKNSEWINDFSWTVKTFKMSMFFSTTTISISKMIPTALFRPLVITLRKWPMEYRNSWIKSTIEYSDKTLAHSYDEWSKRRSKDHFRYRLNFKTTHKSYDSLGIFFSVNWTQHLWFN